MALVRPLKDLSSKVTPSLSCMADILVGLDGNLQVSLRSTRIGLTSNATQIGFVDSTSGNV